MKRLILISSLATLACLFVAGQAVSAGNQTTRMGMSNSGKTSGMMGDGNHGRVMDDGNHGRVMDDGKHGRVMDDGKHNGMMSRNLNAEQIREAQRLLNQHGLKAGMADGIYGKQTRTAIRNFQKSKKLTITGSLDSQTLRALAPTTEKQDFFGLSPTNVK